MTSKQEQNSGPSRFHASQRRMLLELREQLVARLRALSANALTADTDAPVKDFADAGTDVFIRDTELVLLGEEGKRLALVQDALRRMEEGTYGKCVDCGKSISRSRLEALPYAKLCVNCKAVREANDGLPPPEIQENRAFETLVE